MILAGLSCDLHNARYRDLPFSGPGHIFPANVVLWSPAGSVAEYRMRFEAMAGQGEAPLLDLAGTEAFLRDERRRRDELLALLDRGGLAIVDLAGDARLHIHTVETIFEVDLATGLPHPGAGQAEPVDLPVTREDCVSGEPFRSFARAAAGPTARWRLSRHPGTALLRSGDGAVLGFHASIGTGHLVALPLDVAHAPPARLADLLHRIERLAGSLGGVLHGALPPWADTVLTAEEQALRAEARRLADEMARLRAAQAALARQQARLRAGRALVFANGRLLAEAAADAFRAAGGSVLQAREGEGELVVEWADRLHLVAIAGAQAGNLPAEMSRLAGLARQEGARAGLPAGAILLLAGEQDLPPDARAVPPVDPALLQEAATHGVTLLTTMELFAMARAGAAADVQVRWRAWLDAPPRPAGLPDWRRYLSADEGDAANQDG